MPGSEQTKPPAAKRRLDFGDDDRGRKKLAEAATEKVVIQTLVGTVKKAKRRRREENDDTKAYFPSRSTSSPSGVATNAALVTPEKKLDDESDPDAQKSSSQHVPVYIHKNLRYQRRGVAVLSKVRQKVFELIEGHCRIPDNFENDRSFGPLSGTCFEERAIDAYGRGLLTPFSSVTICTHCARLGHEKDECPDLI